MLRSRSKGSYVKKGNKLSVCLETKSKSSILKPHQKSTLGNSHRSYRSTRLPQLDGRGLGTDNTTLMVSKHPSQQYPPQSLRPLLQQQPPRKITERVYVDKETLLSHLREMKIKCRDARRQQQIMSNNDNKAIVANPLDEKSISRSPTGSTNVPSLVKKDNASHSSTLKLCEIKMDKSRTKKHSREISLDKVSIITNKSTLPSNTSNTIKGEERDHHVDLADKFNDEESFVVLDSPSISLGESLASLSPIKGKYRRNSGYGFGGQNGSSGGSFSLRNISTEESIEMRDKEEEFIPRRREGEAEAC